jgi:gliding motility-associated-like protein
MYAQLNFKSWNSFVLSGLFIFLFTIISNQSNAQSCNFLCNGSFEQPAVTQSGGGDVDVKNGQMPCWHTTESDSNIEVWPTGFNGCCGHAAVYAYSGSQFVELNASAAGTLYQNFTVPTGSNVTISFAHQGRAGVDTMSVSVGPVGGPYVTIGKYGDGNTAWAYRSVSYSIPTNLGDYYSFRFNAIYSTGGDLSVGNFLDDVSIQLRDTIIATSTQIKCNGENTGGIAITADEGTPQHFTYSWSASNTDTTSKVSGLGAGTYTVTVTDAYGCVSTTSTLLTQPPALTASTTSTPATCWNSNGQANVLAGGGTPTYTYLWSTSGTGNSISDVIAGTYSVTVTDGNGCTQTSTAVITTNISGTNPTATASMDTVKSGASITLMATGNGTYLWSPAAGLNCDTCANATVSPKQTTKYCVVVSNKSTCSDTACVDVYVPLNLLIPNVFSPNGDGINDVFTITANGYRNIQVVIFDRWGIKVADWTGIAGGWNGQTTSGKDAPASTYYFIATITKEDGTIEKVPGDVYLLR